MQKNNWQKAAHEKENKLLFRLSARLVVPLWITCKRIFSSSSNHIPTWNSACMRSSTKNAYRLKWFHYLFVNSNFCRSNKTMCERRMCLQNPIVNLDPHECDKSNTRLAILSCMLYYYFKQTNRSSATATKTAKWNRAQTKEKKIEFSIQPLLAELLDRKQNIFFLERTCKHNLKKLSTLKVNWMRASATWGIAQWLLANSCVYLCANTANEGKHRLIRMEYRCPLH